MSLALKGRIEAFSRLGDIMKDACGEKTNSHAARRLKQIADKQYLINKWFTPTYIFESIRTLADSLNGDSLVSWLMPYPLPETNKYPKRIAVILAGNIPLVGFHDFLSVLLTGNIFIGKTSSKDRDLIAEITSILIEIEPLFKDLIFLTDDGINNIDAVIATGSNNSSRYFEYYYGNKPHIFRKNRNSVAIIKPDITHEELHELGKDIFYYFGLGCRNVSKLYMHEDFDTNRLKKAWDEYSAHLNITPYRSNYKYNKAMFQVENKEFHDLDFVLLKKDARFSSPVSVLYYSYYDRFEDLKAELIFNNDKIQTIIGKGFTPFGHSQSPALNDYADGIDTIDFLRNL